MVIYLAHAKAYRSLWNGDRQTVSCIRGQGGRKEQLVFDRLLERGKTNFSKEF